MFVITNVVQNFTMDILDNKSIFLRSKTRDVTQQEPSPHQIFAH